MEPKLNCWEYKRCGREPGGRHVAELGACPAATEPRGEGVHGGRRGGRCCWMVAGTFCRRVEHGTFECGQCDFYLKVADEEYPSFQYARELRKQL